jgi:hypothetical protein
LRADADILQVRLTWRSYQPIRPGNPFPIYGNDYPNDVGVVYRLSFQQGDKTRVYIGHRDTTLLARLKEHLDNPAPTTPVQQVMRKHLSGGGKINVESLIAAALPIQLNRYPIQVDLRNLFHRLYLEGSAVIREQQDLSVELLNISLRRKRKDLGKKRKPQVRPS